MVKTLFLCILYTIMVETKSFDIHQSSLVSFISFGIKIILVEKQIEFTLLSVKFIYGRFDIFLLFTITL